MFPTSRALLRELAGAENDQVLSLAAAIAFATLANLKAAGGKAKLYEAYSAVQKDS